MATKKSTTAKADLKEGKLQSLECPTCHFTMEAEKTAVCVGPQEAPHSPTLMEA